MKRFFVLLSVLLIALLSNLSLSNAEKIYYKDGKEVSTKILYCSRGSIWIKVSSGAVGINTQDIDRIENDDGSISKYDYRSLSDAIVGFIGQQRYDEAVRLCTILLETLSSNVRIHYLRGLLNQKLGNFEQAAGDYNFLIKQGVTNAEIFNNLGAIYAYQNKPKEARDFFIKAIGNNPDIVETHNNLANLLLQTKDYNRAIKEYNRVIEKEPNNVKALYNLGISYMNSKSYSKAKEQWQKILAIKPEDKDAKNALEYLKIEE